MKLPRKLKKKFKGKRLTKKVVKYYMKKAEIMLNKAKYVYFIENKRTGNWINKLINSRETNNPLQALQFESRNDAENYLLPYLQEKYTITEHEFISEF